MSLPRQIIPRQFYMVTRRCSQRQFLMRPDPATNNAFIYCLAVAALKYEIVVLLSQTESNHHHTVVFDEHGRVCEFVEYFHRLFARSQNALRGRCENLWAAQEPCITRLLDRQVVIEKLIYTASNPVKDNLVERVHHWPGASAYSSFLTGRPMHATRPRHFFRNPGPMPDSVTLAITIPAELGLADDVIEEVRAGVNNVEHQMRTQRQLTGGRVIGRRRIKDQSWSDSPTTPTPRRGLRPRFAGTGQVRVAALAAYRGFLAAYRDARAKWLAGSDVEFPEGTYWLAKCASVRRATTTSTPTAKPDLTSFPRSMPLTHSTAELTFA